MESPPSHSRVSDIRCHRRDSRNKFDYYLVPCPMSVTVFDNCRLFDGHGPDYIEDHRVVVEDGRIKALEDLSLR